MFPTRFTDIRKIRSAIGHAAFVLSIACSPGYAWFWMEDPLYGSSYDTSRVKFPRVPSTVATKCKTLDGSVAAWNYATASTNSATYYIVNRAFSRIPGETDLVEPDNGMLLMVDKSGCRTTSLLPALNGYAKRTTAFPDSFTVPESVLIKLSRTVHFNYAKAFGGLDRYKRQIRLDIRDKSVIPNIHWQILDSMSATALLAPQSTMTRHAVKKSKTVFPSMYEPVFAAYFDATNVHFEPVSKDLRFDCLRLPNGLPWWIFSRAKMDSHGEAFILSGLREVVPDGPSNEAPVIEPDFGVVALVTGDKCDLVNIDNGLSRQQGDVESDSRFPLPDSTIDALAKDLAQRYQAAFGGKRKLFFALGKDSLGDASRPSQFGQALQALPEH